MNGPFYTSTVDHIEKVRFELAKASGNLQARAESHDRSKLETPELESFEIMGPRREVDQLAAIEFNKAMQHHYEANDHHIESFKDGAEGMDCFQTIEMVIDWYAYEVAKGAPVDFVKVIADRTARHKISPNRQALIFKTAQAMGYL